jgi:iron(III) transport system permease protein
LAITLTAQPFYHKPSNWWLVLAASLLSVPMVTLFISLLWPQWSIWQHIQETVLAEYLLNSLVLCLGVGLLTLIIGASLAWAMVYQSLYFKSWLEWLVLLPMAVPAYIVAYSYTGLLDVAGPVQSTLRMWNQGQNLSGFPEIRSLPGAILMLALVLYPYVYLLARNAFLDQGIKWQQSSQALGITGWRYWQKIALPVARPALFAGVALCMMETLADFGTVEYFGIPTFTTGIVRTWFGMGNAMAAAQLSALLCSLVFLLLMMEKRSQQMAQVYQGQHQYDRASQTSQSPSFKLTLYCAIWPFFGFVLPTFMLAYGAWQSWQYTNWQDYFALITNSFGLAVSAALIICLLSLSITYLSRKMPHPWLSKWLAFCGMGYAIPGVVIAIGVMIPLTLLDKQINLFTMSWFDLKPGLLFSGSLFALLMAYAVRFLIVANKQIENGILRMQDDMEMVALSLAATQKQLFWRVHLPLMRTSILTAMLLVFVDVLKELPATLILRPFNFNTLAVKTYELASDERLNESALPALAIVATGLLPVILLNYLALNRNNH